MNFAVIIPARYASTRFPGKPLAILGNKPVIIHTVENASQATENVVVATDDRRIYDCVESFGYQAIMTSDRHRSGTDRVFEAMLKMNKRPDVVINVQGDEPFISPEQITTLMHCFEKMPDTQIATLIQKFDCSRPISELQDPNLVKVVKNIKNEAQYFSRSIIPYVRGAQQSAWLQKTEYYTHVGIYAYRNDILEQITALPQSSLEKAESLEQLRWLQNGYTIDVALTEHRNIGIDTPEDLAAAANLLFH